MKINLEIIDGVKYYSMTIKGIQYTLHNTGQEWQLHSSRLSLGRHPGSYKFFPCLEALELKLKPFRGISALID